MKKRDWSLEEDNYIKENFGILTFSDMAKHLGCAITTVQKRAIELGLNFEKKSVRRWTNEEIEILKLMAPKYLNKTIAKKLNRTLNELNKKARELDIELIFKRPVWKKWKIEYLKSNINNMPISKIQKELDVNYYQIIDMLDELNIKYVSNHWTEEEEQILKDFASKVYVREIAKILNRTEVSIIKKANRMGIECINLKKKYTAEELNYIKENWGIVSITDMSRNLKVSRTMIQTQANLMNLPKLGNNPYRKWTEEKIEKLNKLSKTKTVTELAKYFNTTNDAITCQAYKCGITLIDSKVHWTEEDNEKLKELAKTMDLSELAIAMNRGTTAIRLHAERLSIKIIPNSSIWTDENTEQLKKLVNEGKKVLEIANIMKKNDETISKKIRDFNLTITRSEAVPWTEEEIKKLIELSKTKKLNELVSLLNRTTSSIKSVAKRYNIKILTDKKNWTEEEYKLLEKLIMVDKKTPKEVAEILGRTEDAIIIKINRRGLKIQTNDKRFWTTEEETILSDLWGTESVEKIAKKLNRTISSIKNKAFLLGLGLYIENNYDGLTIKDISELLNIDITTINVGWISLGLKYKVKKISKSRSYKYVEINDLYEFLEQNQNIWDSRNLEKNILGKEPDWLKEKRRKDEEKDLKVERLNLTKQQLILAKKFFLNIQEQNLEKTEYNQFEDEKIENEDKVLSLTKNKKDN